MTVNSLKQLEHSKIISYHLIGAVHREIEQLRDMYFYGADEIKYNSLYEKYQAEISLLKDEIESEELLFVHIEHYNKHIQCLFEAVLEPRHTDDELEFWDMEDINE